jgi:hypothetical protein
MKELAEYDEVCKGMCLTFSNKLKQSPSSIASIESFIVEEAMEYFLSIEEYEMCGILKEFQDNYPHKIIKVSRREFFDADNWHTI